eukprot:TRINITY_DN7368_c0_g1_i1.p1 TRINITY_DN7368_c0_g1~~TRINITY_DN7368_c0_g1_i1.p1  ORF type:complete len:351 (-),score=72.53 TRINITY_DN7368_c0_g1_i1:4-1056(-)
MPSSRLIESAVSGALYFTVSLCSTFFNKALISSWEFQFTSFTVLAQHIFTVLFLLLLRLFGLISFANPDRHLFLKLLPSALFYSLNIGISFIALATLNVPMYGTLKKLSTPMILYAEKIWLNKAASQKVQMSIVVIVLGVILAGAGDVTFDSFTYGLTFFACIIHAAYLIIVAKNAMEYGINSFGLLFYNSFLSIPFALMASVGARELEEITNYPHLWDYGFQSVFFMNLLLGSLLNYSTFWCIQANSPLTLTILGNLKGAMSNLLGLFLLGGVELTLLNGAGLTLNTLGSFWYSFIKYQESEKAEASQKKIEEEKEMVVVVESPRLPSSISNVEERKLKDELHEKSHEK